MLKKIFLLSTFTVLTSSLFANEEGIVSTMKGVAGEIGNSVSKGWSWLFDSGQGSDASTGDTNSGKEKNKTNQLESNTNKGSETSSKEKTKTEQTTLQSSLPPKQGPVSFKCGLLESPAIVDWLNSINISSFYDRGSALQRHHSNCFVFINSDEKFSVWLEPYGFYSHYSSGKVDVKLSSLGASLGTMFFISDEWNVGGGFGYFHSSFKGSEVSGVYGGSTIEYLFPEGFIGFTALGIGNFYKGAYQTQSWDLNLRLEAEYCIDPPSDFFIPNLTFHPLARIDYLNVFEPGYNQKVKGQKSIPIEERHSSYLYSKLGARIEKMMLCKPAGTLASHLELGWINMSPLSASAAKWTFNKKHQGCPPELESKNQLALGLGIVGMYTNGLLVGIDYEAALGANSPMQTGRLRFEWNW